MVDPGRIGVGLLCVVVWVCQGESHYKRSKLPWISSDVGGMMRVGLSLVLGFQRPFVSNACAERPSRKPIVRHMKHGVIFWCLCLLRLML